MLSSWSAYADQLFFLWFAGLFTSNIDYNQTKLVHILILSRALIFYLE